MHRLDRRIDRACPPKGVGGRSGAAGERLLSALYDGAPPGAGGRPRFVLFAAGDEAAALAARYPGLVEAVPRTPPDPGRLLIVRPDGYIGLSVVAEDFAGAEDYLGGLEAESSSRLAADF